MWDFSMEDIFECLNTNNLQLKSDADQKHYRSFILTTTNSSPCGFFLQQSHKITSVMLRVRPKSILWTEKNKIYSTGNQ